jgi:hypothetical protein
MDITIKEIKDILQRLMLDEISREEASSWAYNLRNAEDSNTLRYIPKESERIIWNAILFVEGIDLQNEPGVYLHDKNDIREYLQKVK